jgi:two-component system OmpR family sensor kinase
MASIRARLATAYAATLVGTVAVLGAVLYGVQREETARELASRAGQDTDLALRVVAQVARSGSTLIATPLNGLIVTPALRNLLEGVPDYVVVLDSAGRTLYTSFGVRQLDPDDQVRLSQAATHLAADGALHAVDLSDRRLLLVTLNTGVDRVAAGVDAESADAGPRALLATDLVLLPLVILLSIAGAYVLSGRAFRPVDVIINEVEAISDGRSLHRRLVVDGAGDEMQRLSETLNQMIVRLETSFGALRRFTADASHELKTPLAVLRADVERAMTAPSHSTEQLVALEEALQETRRMSDLVDSLLTLARADEGRYDILREPVPLEPLVREVFESALILGEDAGLNGS